MNDHFLQSSFAGGSLNYPLVKRVGCHQTVDHDRLGLSNSVTPVLGLQVSLRILNRGQGEGIWDVQK